LFTAPEPVVRYLCAQYKVHNIPVGNAYTKANVEAVMQSHEELKFFFTENERVRRPRVITQQEVSNNFLFSELRISSCNVIQHCVFLLEDVNG
jgi:structural maintenance of chromosomes protein 5